MRGFVQGALIVALLALAVSCDSPFEPGSAVVSLDDGEARAGDDASRSITPDSAPDPVEYRVSGTGPEGATFTQTVTAMPVDVSDLIAGEWAISVEGLDDTGAVVLAGTTVARVSSEGATPVQVTLTPPDGAGQVNLAVSWPPTLVAAPAVSATLYRDGSDPLTLDASVQSADGTASITGSGVAAGWYRLQLRLYDGGACVGGRAQIVQVRADTATTAAVELTELNKPGAAVTVTGTSFTLAWDPPATSDPADPVASYNVYYRVHGTYDWTLLGTTGSLTESYEITASALDYGLYDFAVTSVGQSGAESDPHTSLDDDAQPATGWYVDWGA